MILIKTLLCHCVIFNQKYFCSQVEREYMHGISYGLVYNIVQ